MQTTKEARDCGPLGELADKIGMLVNKPLESVLDQYPEVEIVIVVRPVMVPGVAVLPVHRVKGEADKFGTIERSQRLLRDAADSCGRVLYQSPADPGEVAEESMQIVEYSRAELEHWKKIRKCVHDACAVRDAASAVATGVRILQEIGTPREVLVDLTKIAKEACRRAHLRIVEKSTRAQA